MQTFLPLADFKQSLRALDVKRLWKQTVEAYQILNTLEGKSVGWKNHPACKMWEGYEDALRLYYNLALEESIRRGIKVTKLKPATLTGEVVIPSWFGKEEFHASHRSNLLRKDREFYAVFGWEEPDNLPYVWPTK